MYPSDNYLNLGNYGLLPSESTNPMAGLGLRMNSAYGLQAPGSAMSTDIGGNLFGLSKPFFSTPTQQGWGGMALGGAAALGNLFMGMKQYGLAKDTLAQNKLQFDTNYAAQKGLTNASLEDRQRARVASNPGAYQSVGDYMAANGVK